MIFLDERTFPNYMMTQRKLYVNDQGWAEASDEMLSSKSLNVNAIKLVLEQIDVAKDNLI